MAAKPQLVGSHKGLDSLSLPASYPSSPPPKSRIFTRFFQALFILGFLYSVHLWRYSGPGSQNSPLSTWPIETFGRHHDVLSSRRAEQIYL